MLAQHPTSNTLSAFLPGLAQKVEAIEAKRLNPFYPGPRPHASAHIFD
jgi:hypothetical protein